MAEQEPTEHEKLLLRAYQDLAAAQKLAADMQIAKDVYTLAQRREIYALLAQLEKSEAYADETVGIVREYANDERSFEQFAEDMGHEYARRRFTNKEQAATALKNAQSSYYSARLAYPLLDRIYKRTRQSY